MNKKELFEKILKQVKESGTPIKNEKYDKHLRALGDT